MSMLKSPKRDWKTLAQLAATEPDPQKLLELVNELNDVLEEHEHSRRGEAR